MIFLLLSENIKLKFYKNIIFIIKSIYFIIFHNIKRLLIIRISVIVRLKIICIIATDCNHKIIINLKNLQVS